MARACSTLRFMHEPLCTSQGNAADENRALDLVLRLHYAPTLTFVAALWPG